MLPLNVQLVRVGLEKSQQIPPPTPLKSPKSEPNVAAERAVGQRRAGGVAVHPAAVGGVSVADRKPVNTGGRRAPEGAVTTLPAQLPSRTVGFAWRSRSARLNVAGSSLPANPP